MLIDVTSFTSGPRQIENAAVPQKTANHIAVAERINGYIDFYQTDFLRHAVGPHLCSDIDAYSRVEHHTQEETLAEENSNGEQVAYEEPNERMESLIALLREPFAEYVFFYMLRDMNALPTITGLVQLKCANSYVSPLEKGVQAWNRMVEGLELFAREAKGLGVEGVTIDKNMLTYLNTFNL